MILGTLCSVAAIVCLAAMSPQNANKPPVVLRGTVRSVEGNIIALDSPSLHVPNGRQVDISFAKFERLDGKRIPRITLRSQDTVIVIIDPNAPTEYRPKPAPGRPMPMFIRLLPLRALVVKRLQAAAIDPRVKP